MTSLPHGFLAGRGYRNNVGNCEVLVAVYQATSPTGR